jgi:hypothetical protein
MRFWDIGTAILEGVVSIPVDLYYGGRRTLEDLGAFGEEVAAENALERKRVSKLIESAVRDPKVLERVVRIIVEDFVERLPDSTIDKMNEKLKLRVSNFSQDREQNSSCQGIWQCRLPSGSSPIKSQNVLSNLV